MTTIIRRIDPDTTVNDVVRLYPGTIPLFNEYGIDTCCGGGVSLAVAAQRDNVELSELLGRLRQASERG
jgi:iron-sulfur cluster repair protein YtfE (RIC family)